jgi:hypothetical protein
MQSSQEKWAELGIDNEKTKKVSDTDNQEPTTITMQQQHLKINRQHSKTATRQITTNSYTAEIYTQQTKQTPDNRQGKKEMRKFVNFDGNSRKSSKIVTIVKQTDRPTTPLHLSHRQFNINV